MKVTHNVLDRFNKWALTYDTSILQKLMFEDSHKKFINEIKPTSSMKVLVLDMACGTGNFSFRLAKCSNQIEVKGIDYSSKMIDIANKKLAISNLSNIEFKQGSVNNIPYANNLFDIVVCSNAFHHFQNQQKALNEMYRVLKINGKLLIIDGSKDVWLGRLIFGFFVEHIERKVHHCVKNEMYDLLCYTGFQQIRQEVFNISVPLLFSVGVKV